MNTYENYDDMYNEDEEVNPYDELTDRIINIQKERYGLVQSCIVKIRIDNNIINSLWLTNDSEGLDGEFQDDWYEGEDDIQLLGVLPINEIEVPSNI